MTSGTAKSSEQKLSRLRQTLRKQYLKMKQTALEEPEFAETPDAWLARTIYRKLKGMVKNGEWKIFEQIVDKQQGLDAGPHPVRGQPFKLGLIVLLSPQLGCQRNRRMELSNAMEYAFRHNVPSKNFNGFVNQAGQKQIAKKLKVGHTEPGFKLREGE